jgi:hypothetical protein
MVTMMMRMMPATGFSNEYRPENNGQNDEEQSAKNQQRLA